MCSVNSICWVYSQSSITILMFSPSGAEARRGWSGFGRSRLCVLQVRCGNSSKLLDCSIGTLGNARPVLLRRLSASFRVRWLWFGSAEKEEASLVKETMKMIKDAQQCRVNRLQALGATVCETENSFLLPVSTSTDGIERLWLDNGLMEAERCFKAKKEERKKFEE